MSKYDCKICSKLIDEDYDEVVEVTCIECGQTMNICELCNADETEIIDGKLGIRCNCCKHTPNQYQGALRK